ncbi:MAG: tetratricopeptide repeat protein [Sediminicola sp.]
MKGIVSLIFILISFWANAQNEALFNNATTAYNSGEYEKAIENYLEIIGNGQHSPELYFNLGNAYYKTNQIAPSIYYYEKALLLRPNDPEITTNLGYAKNMTLDAIVPTPRTGLGRIFEGITGFLSFEQWSYAAVTLMILFVLFYLAFHFASYATHKRIAFVSAFICFAGSVLSIALAYNGYTVFKENRPAIVFKDEIIVKSEPNNRSQETFRIHEGTKVNVLDSLGDWNKIELLDGKTGWLPSAGIKQIRDF